MHIVIHDYKIEEIIETFLIASNTFELDEESYILKE